MSGNVNIISKNYPICFVLSISLMLLVILLVNGFRAYNEFEGYHQTIGKNKVSDATNNIVLTVENARKSLTLFSRDNEILLQAIQTAEDKSIVFDELITSLNNHFPERRAFALANERGFVIIDDHGEFFGQKCLDDIRIFASTRVQPKLHIHADKHNGHIDLMVPWKMKSGRAGVFVVSFTPQMIINTLNSSQILGHQILITKTKSPSLIDVLSSNINTHHKVNQHLNDAEMQRISYREMIPGTLWTLNDVFDKDLLIIQRDNIFSQGTFSFILFSLLSGILLYFVKKEEWRRHIVEKKLKLLNENLESKVADRTEALVLLNSELKRENGERKLAEKKLKRIARFDTLTELPNRLLLNERLQQAYTIAKRLNQRYALFFLDIDHFKHINDSFGHSFGDKLLVIIAQRLALSVRKEDMIARFGGDEFAIIINNLNGNTNLTHIAEKIINTVVQPIMIDQQELFVTVSIGIAIYPNDGDTIESLVSNADAAMYRSKLDGRNSFAFFTQDMAEKLKRRHKLNNSLQQALLRNEFQVFYQVKIDVFSQEIIGAEALLRWTHPTIGPIKPEEFIPILEENGLISSVGAWVIEQVCIFLQNRILHHEREIPVAINLSANQFRDQQLASNVRDLLQKYKVPASFIEFEVTESLLIKNLESTQSVLNQFQDMGIKITIDDFGTGYASINYLRLFPVNSLKIDATFLKNITENHEDAAIVRAIVAMAHSLNLTCIAEGVETIEQLNIIKSHHCDAAQGYYFSEPLAKTAFSSWIKSNMIEPLDEI